eukprot:932836-Prymnesium_polylepis.1
MPCDGLFVQGTAGSSRSGAAKLGAAAAPLWVRVQDTPLEKGGRPRTPIARLSQMDRRQRHPTHCARARVLGAPRARRARARHSAALDG